MKITGLYNKNTHQKAATISVSELIFIWQINKKGVCTVGECFFIGVSDVIKPCVFPCLQGTEDCIMYFRMSTCTVPYMKHLEASCVLTRTVTCIFARELCESTNFYSVQRWRKAIVIYMFIFILLFCLSEV